MCNLVCKMHLSPREASAAISVYLLLPLFVGFFCLVLEEERAGCFTLSSCCLVGVSVLCLFLMVLWVGLQCVIVVHCISWSYSLFVHNVCIDGWL